YRRWGTWYQPCSGSNLVVPVHEAVSQQRVLDAGILPGLLDGDGKVGLTANHADVLPFGVRDGLIEADAQDGDVGDVLESEVLIREIVHAAGAAIRIAIRREHNARVLERRGL